VCTCVCVCLLCMSFRFDPQKTHRLTPRHRLAIQWSGSDLEPAPILTLTAQRSAATYGPLQPLSAPSHTHFLHRFFSSPLNSLFMSPVDCRTANVCAYVRFKDVRATCLILKGVGGQLTTISSSFGYNATLHTEYATLCFHINRRMSERAKSN